MRDELKECLDTARRINLAVMGICGALLLLGLTPREAEKYERGVRALRALPDIPGQNDSASDGFWRNVQDPIDELQRIKRKQGREVEVDAHPEMTGRLTDPDGKLTQDFYFAPASSDIARPSRWRVEDIARFLDDMRWALSSAVNGEAFRRQLLSTLPSDCHPCKVRAAEVSRSPAVREWVSAIVTVDNGGAPRVLSIARIPALSEGEGSIQRVLQALFHGVAPDSYSIKSDREWQTYVLGDVFERDLAPVLDETGYLSREQAIAETAMKAQKSLQTISLLGLTIDERLATLGGPAILLAAMGFLLVHLFHLRGVAGLDQGAIALYPWPPLFPRYAGFISAFLMLAGVPALALAIFLLRVWLGTDVTQGAVLGRSLVASAAGLTAVAVGIVSLRTVRRLEMAAHEAPKRGAVAHE